MASESEVVKKKGGGGGGHKSEVQPQRSPRSASNLTVTRLSTYKW